MKENSLEPKSRVLRKRYGIKIEFHQAGMLGKFSLASLVIKLVSGMGLLTLTATIVDTLALYVLPDRFRYRSYVYETSPVHEKEIKQD
ncbi:P2X receptor [Paramuricea clavata]|uniref:P2X receptor n=1 Tax=Paramuricea clavata TaxID=317549 RepID=A0A7D9LDX6_PARCT|nr:P2X receptor [Paramuricea clavata]